MVVAERASRDEGTAVAVWDVHSGQELSRFGLLECGGKSAGERVTRLLPSFDRHGRLVAWFAGCDSGAILRFHDGDRAEERSCGGPKRK